MRYKLYISCIYKEIQTFTLELEVKSLTLENELLSIIDQLANPAILDELNYYNTIPSKNQIFATVKIKLYQLMVLGELPVAACHTFLL